MVNISDLDDEAGDDRQTSGRAPMIRGGLLDPSTFPPVLSDESTTAGPAIEPQPPLLSEPLDPDTHAEVLRDIQNAQVQLPLESPRSVFSMSRGVVSGAGWQNPGDHGAGMGWRVYVTEPDGSRIGYGHMDPASTPAAGISIQAGDPLGQYASPTNGHSSGPHVHVQRFDARGAIVDPGALSPLHGAPVDALWS
jgi:murein DD-endopeptidase MepM/ murein hydrolase activator NlpD